MLISRLSKPRFKDCFRYKLSLSIIVNSHFDLASHACLVCYKFVQLIFLLLRYEQDMKLNRLLNGRSRYGC